MGAELRNDTNSRPIPTTGMRGGLGRTLLTAFLILTILPLALVGWYAVRQNYINLQQEAGNKLQAIAVLKAHELQLWLEDRGTLFSSAAEMCGAVENAPGCSSWEHFQEQDPGLVGAILLDGNDKMLWSVGTCAETPNLDGDLGITSDALVKVALPRDEGALLLCHRLSALSEVLSSDASLGDTTHIHLIQNGASWPEAFSEQRRLAGTGTAQYINQLDVPVIGAYASLPDLDLGILVEQERTEIVTSSDRIAAMLIAVILGVVLVATFIASVVIRSITRPVIWLTESALEMAEGNLDQHVMVTSKDEIGILTYVFNKMAAELKSLYDDLEDKVVKRTRMLQQVNYQIQRRALHLEASLEVSRAITSVRDPVALLTEVANLICARFLYASVAVYLLEPGGGQARLHAISPPSADWPEVVHAGDGSVLERALRKAAPQVQMQQLVQSAWYQRSVARVAIPLKMGPRVLGALAVLSTEREGVQEDELKVLAHLANQVSIALENARAYERERMAAQQLEEAEVFKDRFLSNMSHELREPLNAIIGFSRLMLKGLDGALSPQQSQDLHRIYSNSHHLLTLINDLLAISEIRAGLMELRLGEVALPGIIDSVMPTANALVRGKEIVLDQEIDADLPFVWADADRLRQVLVHLLSNAAKFTEEGKITIRAWADEELAYVSINDTGIGIPQDARGRIFNGFDKGGEQKSHGAGLGLVLSREFVEMHGGQIWLESKVGSGSTFTFSIPLCMPVHNEKSADAALNSVTA